MLDRQRGLVALNPQRAGQWVRAIVRQGFCKPGRQHFYRVIAHLGARAAPGVAGAEGDVINVGHGKIALPLPRPELQLFSKRHCRFLHRD